MNVRATHRMQTAAGRDGGPAGERRAVHANGGERAAELQWLQQRRRIELLRERSVVTLIRSDLPLVVVHESESLLRAVCSHVLQCLQCGLWSESSEGR